MFETIHHDFGSVACGAKAQFEFALSNIYVEDVHITDAQPSCHCTIVTFDKATLKSYDKGAIVATLNTQAFQGQRAATITVTFDKPFYAQATLSVRGFIRTDVVFQPGSIELGSVAQGNESDQKVSMYYSGWQQDWKVLGVNSPNSGVSARAVETARQGNQVWYEVLVHLAKDAPAGYLRDHLMLTTNDQQSGQIDPAAGRGARRAGIGGDAQSVDPRPGPVRPAHYHTGDRQGQQAVPNPGHHGRRQESEVQPGKG
jgi:hypothetical protein